MVAAALLGVGVSTAPKAKAANLYWDNDATAAGNTLSPIAGLGGAGTWGATDAKWFDGNSTDVTWTNANKDIAYFTGTGGTVTLGTSFTVGGLVFASTGYELTANTITLARTGTDGASLITVGQGNYLTGTGIRSVISSTLASETGVGLTKVGNGTLILGAAANTYSGTTSIRGGVLAISSQAQLGTSTGTIAVFGTTTVGIESGSLMLNGGAVSGAGQTITRELSLAGRGNNTIGSGALISIGNNTFTSDVVTSSATETRITAGAGTTTFSGRVFLGGGGQNAYFYGPGNFVLSGQVVGGISGASNIIKSTMGLGTTTLVLTNNNNTMLGGIRAEAGTVRVSDGGQLGLGNDITVSKGGNLNFNSGTFEIRSDNLASFATKNISMEFNGGTIFVDHAVGSSGINGVVSFANFRQENNRTFTFSGRNGYGVTITAVNNNGSGGQGEGFTNSGNGLVTITGDIWGETNTTAQTLTITATGEMSLLGSVLATSANHVFTKVGTGSLSVSGSASTYIGATNVNAGTLSIANIGGLGTTALTSIALAGGTLNYSGSGQTWARSLLLNKDKSIVTANGTGAVVVTSNTGYNGTTAGNTLFLGGTNSNTNEIRGIVSNTTSAAAVTKFDSGTWQITSAPTTAAQIGTAYAGSGVSITTTAASQTVTLAAGTVSALGLVVGQRISNSAAGIPHGATISQIISSTQFSISQAAVTAVTANTTSTIGTVTGSLASIAVTANTGNTLTVGSTANLVVGQPISGTGLLASAGWYVATITSGTAFTVANTTGTAAIANSAAIATQTLGLSPSFAGALTISGGTVIASATTASANTINDSSALTFAVDAIRGTGYGAGGTFNYSAFSTGSTETMGILSISAGAGTVQITPTAGTNTLTFGSITAPAVGTGLNFIVPTTPGTNSIVLMAGGTAGLLNAHAYYNGANFAYNPGGANAVLAAARARGGGSA